MKKIFKLKVENKKPERQADSIKYEVKKYIKRERKKKLPETADYWDFDCKIGAQEDSAEKIHLKEINPSIDKQLELGSESFYLEILARATSRVKS
jgi:hypothetical protein